MKVTQEAMIIAAKVGLHIGMRVWHKDGANGPDAKVFGTVVGLHDDDQINDIMIEQDNGSMKDAWTREKGEIVGTGWNPVSLATLPYDVVQADLAKHA